MSMKPMLGRILPPVNGEEGVGGMVFVSPKLTHTIFKNLNGYHLLKTENVPSVVLSTWHISYL